MKKFKLTYAIVFLTLLCNVTNAQTDTITAIYGGAINSDTGSASCCSGGCMHILPVALPPAFTVTDIRCSFTYHALGACTLDSGGWCISLDSCSAQCISCPHYVPSACAISQLSIYNDVKSCIPGPACSADTLLFTMHFWRKPSIAGTGCSFSCIVGMDSTYRISVIGTRDSCPTNVIEQEFPSTFKISPNPAANQLRIRASVSNPHEATVSIINMLGEIKQKEKIKLNKEGSINIKELPVGMYFIKVADETGEWTGRFMKQ